MSQQVAKVFNPGNPITFVPHNKLSVEDQAKSDLIRLTCEGDLYWAVASIRWCGSYGISKSEDNWKTTIREYFTGLIPSWIQPVVLPMIKAQITRDAKGHGFIRHSPNDQLFLAKRALKALSTTLGQRQFFLGDFISEVDCVAFGTLENLSELTIWPNPLTQFLHDECKNLLQYTKNIQEIY